MYVCVCVCVSVCVSVCVCVCVHCTNRIIVVKLSPGWVVEHN